MSRIKELKDWVDSLEVNTESVDRTLPLNAMRADAARVMNFASDYWSATPDRPGLENAGFGISKEIISLIRYVIDSIGYVQAQYISQLQLDDDKTGRIERGQQLLFDFVTFLEWYIASSDSYEWDDRIYKMEADHPEKDMDSPDQLAYALYDYAELSKEILEREKEVADISLKNIDEAMSIVADLVDLGSNPTSISDDAKALLKLKFQLAAILQKNVFKVRKAAHFVFRNHPIILEKAISTYIFSKAAAYRTNGATTPFYKTRKHSIPTCFAPKT